MAAPNVKSWVKGRLYLATSDSAAAYPLSEPIDFNYDTGAAMEARPYAGASTTPHIQLLNEPSLAINYNRRADQDLVGAAYRHNRDNLTGVRFYCYADTVNEALVYCYGLGLLEGVSMQGSATSGQQGSFTIKCGPESTWDDARFIL